MASLLIVFQNFCNSSLAVTGLLLSAQVLDAVNVQQQTMLSCVSRESKPDVLKLSLHVTLQSKKQATQNTG